MLSVTFDAEQWVWYPYCVKTSQFFANGNNGNNDEMFGKTNTTIYPTDSTNTISVNDEIKPNSFNNH